ncbi:hypothetical protein [Streptomyces sp. NPDC017941]|uniref:hypothetical protein n=1 Tax=Streptomyces sp. NPDC017941 TaxID=3365018 RepID=UPI003795066A
MTASRNPLPSPDMSGLEGDWKTLQDLRRREAERDAQSRTEPEPQPEPQPEPDRSEDAADVPAGTQAKPPASRPGRTRGGRRPPPAAADAIPTTVRFDPDESVIIDMFVLELQTDAHRRRLDKAEVFRELIRLAREHEPTRRALVKRLK